MSARDERKKKRKRKGASASKPRRVSERGAAKKGTAKKDTAKKGTAKKGAAEKGAAEKSAADGNQPREDGTHEAPALAPRQRFGHLLLAALVAVEDGQQRLQARQDLLRRGGAA